MRDAVKRRAWEIANRDKVLAYKKKYRLDRLGRYVQMQWEYRRSIIGRYYAVRANARHRKHEFSISMDEFKSILAQECFYCGGSLPKVGSGIDRIDPNKGYITGNIRPCCRQCNLSKSNLTEEEFRQWILRVYNHWK